MSRRTHPQTMHHGVKNKLSRKGKVITATEGTQIQTTFHSIRQARRFMRTGRTHRG